MSLTHSLHREAEPYAERLQRLPRSPKRIHSSFNIRNRSSPNILANALNQTFQLNSTSAASHVHTPPRSSDAIPSVSKGITNPTLKPQYKDIGVQKNLNFTRSTSNMQPSEDVSSCIMKLEAENRELRAQAETHKREREAYRDNLDELKKRYSSSGSHRHPLPSSSGPSNFIPYPPQEFSTHPKWRTRHITTDNRYHPMDVQEPEYPPIETLLLTPSPPESISPSTCGRTPTEPRGHRMKARGGDAQGSQVSPYYEARQHGRRRAPAEMVNGRRRRGKLGGPSSSSHSEKSVGSSGPPNSSASAEAGVSGTLPRTDGTVTQANDNANDQGLYLSEFSFYHWRVTKQLQRRLHLLPPSLTKHIQQSHLSHRERSQFCTHAVFTGTLYFIIWKYHVTDFLNAYFTTNLQSTNQIVKKGSSRFHDGKNLESENVSVITSW